MNAAPRHRIAALLRPQFDRTARTGAGLDPAEHRRGQAHLGGDMLLHARILPRQRTQFRHPVRVG